MGRAHCGYFVPAKVGIHPKNMKKKAKDLYYVAVKVFLRKGDTFLVFKDGFGKWDLPGGRIRYEEFRKPLESVIERKIREELGASFRYKLGEPFIFMRHERPEFMPHGPKMARIFAIGYHAKFLGGTINLASHHTEYEWVPIKTYKPEKYFEGGWLAGVKEFLKIERKKKS
jgi:ADP-ribose pyrophosphatase YjhB (NUDIX family)